MSSGTNNARDLEILEIEGIMRTEGGRKFLMRILERANTFGDTFDNDPYTHARNSGMRSVGTWLDQELKEVNIDMYQRMIKEYHDE